MDRVCFSELPYLANNVKCEPKAANLPAYWEQFQNILLEMTSKSFALQPLWCSPFFLLKRNVLVEIKHWGGGKRKGKGSLWLKALIKICGECGVR